MEKEQLLRFEPIFQRLGKQYPPSLVEHLVHSVGAELVETNELLYQECRSYAEILFDLVTQANTAIARQADASIFLRSGSSRLFQGVAEEAAFAIVQSAKSIERFQATTAFQKFRQADIGSRPLSLGDGLNSGNTHSEDASNAIALAMVQTSQSVENLRATLRNEERMLLNQRERLQTVLQSSHRIKEIAERLADELQRNIAKAGIDKMQPLEAQPERRFYAKRPVSGFIQTTTPQLPRPLSGLGHQHGVE